MRIRLPFLLILLGTLGCREPTTEITVDESGPMEELPIAASDARSDWPWWRGPTRDGIAADQKPPTQWSETKNVVWKAEVPGRGHASPVVVGARVFLATADDDAEVQSVLCFDRKTGEQLWHTEVHEGDFESDRHGDDSHASSTLACDDERVFALFLNDEKIWLTALDLDGEILWQRDVGNFDSYFGFGSSPAIYKSYVIIAADHKSGGFLAAVHRKTGEIRWRKLRPEYEMGSYASPAIFHAAGKDQLLISGLNMLASYDPNNGDQIWSVQGTTQLTVSSVVSDGELAFASGGWPETETICVRADGSKEVLWRNTTKIYTSSPLVYQGHLYAVQDKGVAYCWEATTGELKWRERLGEEFSASLVLADGQIYASSERGTTFVFNANPQEYQQVAANKLGDEIWATPSLCGDQIFLRIARNDANGRQEFLYCIGQE